MKFVVIFLFFILIAGAIGSNYENMNNSMPETDSIFDKKSTISTIFYDKNDAAHFKYHENESHILQWYEWWYANLKGENGKGIVTIFFTLGDLNNPILSTAGVFVAFLDEKESIEKITCYPFIDYSLDYEKCNVSIAGNRFYEKDGTFIIEYEEKGFSISMKLYPEGKPFGNATKIKDWQWAAWYVAMPYGKGEAWVKCKGREYYIKGNAYHDHNWGISKKMDFKWDWGEFNVNNEFAIIYGFAGNGERKGGIHFVNGSDHIFIPYGEAKIEYIEWERICGFKEPTKMHLYGQQENISIDFYVELQKAYMLGYKKIGKPYLLGKTYGSIKINGKEMRFSSVGFYEHHEIMPW